MLDKKYERDKKDLWKRKRESKKKIGGYSMRSNIYIVRMRTAG